MDWQDTLERAIPQPPPTHPDPSALVAEGKRRVRRRRVAAVAGAAAAVAAVIGIGALVAPSRDSATPNPPIATQSTAEEEWPPEVDIPLSDLAPVAYDFDTGETTLHEGWTEVDRVGPFTSGNSLAVAATNGEKSIYAYFESPSEISFTDAARTTTKDFKTWVDGIALTPLETTWLAGGKLSVGVDGWRIVRETPNPLGYAAPWDSVGAVVERDGLEQWIVLDGHSTGSNEDSYELVTTYAIPGETIEDWLARVDRADRQDYRPGDNEFGATTTDAVAFGSGSDVVPAENGVKILEQAADPDVHKTFSAGTSRTAAARITVGGEERYVLVRETGGTTEGFSYTVLPAPRADDRRPLTLDEFAAMVKRGFSPGWGLWR